MNSWLVEPPPQLVSVMLANNETGVLQPVAEIVRRCKCRRRPRAHRRQPGRRQNPSQLPRARRRRHDRRPHKFHGPRGIGALLVRHGTALQPLLHGGFATIRLAPRHRIRRAAARHPRRPAQRGTPTDQSAWPNSAIDSNPASAPATRKPSSTAPPPRACRTLRTSPSSASIGRHCSWRSTWPASLLLHRLRLRQRLQRTLADAHRHGPAERNHLLKPPLQPRRHHDRRRNRRSSAPNHRRNPRCAGTKNSLRLIVSESQKSPFPNCLFPLSGRCKKTLVFSAKTAKKPPPPDVKKGLNLIEFKHRFGPIFSPFFGPLLLTDGSAWSTKFSPFRRPPRATMRPRQGIPTSSPAPKTAWPPAAIDWLLHPGEHAYSPLVLHGPSGTGKSHLAQAVAQSRPNATCTHAADFARELAESIDNGTASQWRTKYRTAQMLVFEDLTHLADRDAAQTELLHTLDELEAQQVPVVITSRLAPSELTQLSAALRSRVTSGLEVPLSPPGSAARKVILQRLAAARGLRLSPGALQLLATGLDATVTELRGILVELEMQSPKNPAVSTQRDTSLPNSSSRPYTSQPATSGLLRRKILRPPPQSTLRRFPPSTSGSGPQRCHLYRPPTDGQKSPGPGQILRRPRPHHDHAQLPQNRRPSRRRSPNTHVSSQPPQTANARNFNCGKTVRDCRQSRSI